MKQAKMMIAKALFFVITLFSVGLQANNNINAKAIHNEVNVCEHDQAVLPCGGASNLDYRWKERILPGPRRNIPANPSKYSYDNSSLIVKNVQAADTKKLFYCHTQSSVHRYKITYVYSLKIVCKDVQTNVGYKLELNCNVDIPDDDIRKIQWKFHTQHHGRASWIDSKTTNGRITMKDRKLTIHKVKMDDSGTFTCVVWRKKNFHLSKGKFFYNLLVEKAPTTTPPQTTTEVPTTDTSTANVPNTKSTQLPEQTTSVPPQITTKVPTFPPVVDSTTTSSKIPTTKPVATTLSTVTTPEKTTSLPPFPTMPSASTGQYTSSSTASNTPTKQSTSEARPTTVVQGETLPTKHSTKPTEKRINAETLPRTLNPKFRLRTTATTNAIDLGNDKMAGDRATTTSNSSGTIASVVALIGFCSLALLFLFFKS